MRAKGAQSTFRQADSTSEGAFHTRQAGSCILVARELPLLTIGTDAALFLCGKRPWSAGKAFSGALRLSVSPWVAGAARSKTFTEKALLTFCAVRSSVG